MTELIKAKCNELMWLGGGVVEVGKGFVWWFSLLHMVWLWYSFHIPVCYGIDRCVELGCGTVVMVTSLLSTVLPFFSHHYGIHTPIILLNVLFDLFQVDDAQEMINSAANQVTTEAVYFYLVWTSFALITPPFKPQVGFEKTPRKYDYINLFWTEIISCPFIRILH